MADEGEGIPEGGENPDQAGNEMHDQEAGAPQDGEENPTAGDDAPSKIEGERGTKDKSAVGNTKSAMGEDSKSALGDKSAIGDENKSTVDDQNKSAMGDENQSAVGGDKSALGEDKKSALDDENKSVLDGDEKKTAMGDVKKSRISGSVAPSKVSGMDAEEKKSKEIAKESGMGRSKAGSKASALGDEKPQRISTVSKASAMGDEKPQRISTVSKASAMGDEKPQRISTVSKASAMGDEKPQRISTVSQASRLSAPDDSKRKTSDESRVSGVSRASDLRGSDSSEAQKSRLTARSSKSKEPRSMTASKIRSQGVKSYVESRKTAMKGESDDLERQPSKRMSSFVDKRQKMSILSDFTMEQMSHRPISMAPPPTRKSSVKRFSSRSYGSKLLNASDLQLGGTRMSTLTDYLRRKQIGSRIRASSREFHQMEMRAQLEGRPTLYEEYTRQSDARIRELSQYFTPEQMMEYKDAFYNFDDDIDGFIPIGEVPFLMRALCQNPTEEELFELITEVDIDCLGSIDFPDFLTIMAKKCIYNPIDYDEVVRAFETFDNHNNGYICAKELVYLMTTFGETLSEEEMGDMLREVEMTDDYEVPYEEFARKITNC